MNISVNIKKSCMDCNVILDESNFHASQAKKHFYICVPCRRIRMEQANDFRAAIKLSSGELKQVRHINKKGFLDKNEGSQYLGKYNRTKMSLDDFAKNLGLGSVAEVQKEVIKSKDKKPRTAEQYARSIERRIININSDRVLNRYAREQKIVANLRNPDGTLKDWFLTKYAATHCTQTGVEFQARGPFQKSVDQIIAGNNYEEENVQVVCLMYNWAKNRFTDADVLKMCISMYEKIKSVLV